MINNVLRSLFYFVLFVAIQVLFLNHIHFLRLATPFVYIYFLLKLPIGTSKENILILSFMTGLVIDTFTNTPGMHTAACTLAGFSREPLIRFLIGKDLPEGTFPSYRSFGYGGFIRYTLFFTLIHHIALFLIESFSLFDPLFFLLRIGASIITTVLLICTVEAFNMETQKSGEK